jgi:hypothetical protein
MILGIDPGPKQSAFLLWDAEKQAIHNVFGIMENNQLREELKTWLRHDIYPGMTVAIEMVQSFGMPVGKEVFETVLFIGRLVEIFDGGGHLVYRKDIKIHFCQTVRATDSNIRTALIDRFGDPGTKKAPGMLYGIKKDAWSALAVAVFYADTKGENL